MTLGPDLNSTQPQSFASFNLGWEKRAAKKRENDLLQTFSVAVVNHGYDVHELFDSIETDGAEGAPAYIHTLVLR